MMPLAKDTGPRESERYCSYCFKNGKLLYEGSDLKEFQKHSYDAMVAHGTNRLLAKFYVYMIRFAPRWKKQS
jgi:Putative zinc ribbon domain